MTVENTSDVTNLVEGDRYRSRLVLSADRLSDILKQFCGPYATNAAIKTRITSGVMTDMGKAQESVVERFTKDGISIAKSLIPEDVMMGFLSNLARHIGQTVDDRCHDGTTTSMLLFTRLVRHFSDMTFETPGERVLMSKAIYPLLMHLENVVKQSTYTVDSLVKRFAGAYDRSDVMFAMAFHQALLASKGDYKLADAIGRVISTIPVEIHSYYEMNQTPLEIDEPYAVETRDYEIGLTANMDRAFYTSRVDAMLDIENASLLMVPEGIVSNTPPADAVIAMMLNDPGVIAELKKIPEGVSGKTRADRFISDPRFMLDTYQIQKEDGQFLWDGPLMVLGPRSASDDLFFEIRNIWNRLYPEHRVIDAMYCVNSDLGAIYQYAITVMGMRVPMDTCMHSGPEQAIVKGVHITYADGFMRISGLFPKGTDLLHPAYLDPTLFQPYTDNLASIQRKIAQSKVAHVKTYTNSDRMAMISLYRSMTCRKWYELRIGGTTYETVANRDVVQDAYGAAISAVTDGVVLNGHYRLDMMCQPVLNTTPYPLDARACEAFRHAFRDILETIYQAPCWTLDQVWQEAVQADSSKTVYLVPLWQPVNGVNVVAQTFLSSDSFMMPADIWKAYRSMPDYLDRRAELDQQRTDEEAANITPIPVQPTAGYLEQFRRLRAILPNLVNSSAFIDVK